MHNHADRHTHDPTFSLKLLRIGHLVIVAGAHVLADHGTAHHTAGAAVDDVHAHRADALCKTDTLFRSPTRIVLDGQAHEERLIGRPVSTNGFYNFRSEPHPVLLRAAILVVPHICVWRQKLVD